MPTITLITISGWIVGIALFGLQYLKYYQYTNKYLFDFWARRQIDQNLTDVDRHPFAGFYTASVGILAVFFAKGVLHNVSLAGYILTALLIGFGLLVLWNIPVSIRQRIKWYRLLPPADQQLYKRNLLLLRNLYISGLVLVGFIIISLSYLSQ
jgi:hypothetical protein